MSSGQEIDCWLLTNAKLTENLETFWINKKTMEIMKLGEQFGNRYRYKLSWDSAIKKI